MCIISCARLLVDLIVWVGAWGVDGGYLYVCACLCVIVCVYVRACVRM